MAIETEKITLNLGLVDLGQVELLVQEGFYSTRTDFLRTAIRNQLALHADVLKQAADRKTLVLGLQRYTRKDLEAVKAAGKKLQIRCLGLATIDEDVSPELALATIDELCVLGARPICSRTGPAMVLGDGFPLFLKKALELGETIRSCPRCHGVFRHIRINGASDASWRSPHRPIGGERAGPRPG